MSWTWRGLKPRFVWYCPSGDASPISSDFLGEPNISSSCFSVIFVAVSVIWGSVIRSIYPYRSLYRYMSVQATWNATSRGNSRCRESTEWCLSLSQSWIWGIETWGIIMAGQNNHFKSFSNFNPQSATPSNWGFHHSPVIVLYPKMSPAVLVPLISVSRGSHGGSPRSAGRGKRRGRGAGALHRVYPYLGPSPITTRALTWVGR